MIKKKKKKHKEGKVNVTFLSFFFSSIILKEISDV